MTQDSPTVITTPRPARFGLPTCHRSYKWVAIVAALLAIARCWSIAGVYNHTTDELAHIAGSVGLYESGRNLYMVEHPTLPRLVVGAALKAVGVEYPKARGLTAVQSRPDANVAGAEIVFDGKVDYWKVLTTARRANLVFLALLLFYTWLLGSYVANPLAAMLAVVFLSLDPNVLAHAALVTTDLPAAAGFLAATYHALRFTAHPTWRTATVAAVALGLAMSCKFTCVLLAPPILVLIVFRAVRHKRRSGWLRYLIAIPVITFLTLWATYLFNVGRLEDQHLFGPEKAWNRIPQSVKHAPIPMPSMPLGFMFMAAIGKTGFPCYLNGHLDMSGHLLYFPETIALKTPAAFVLAIPLALIAFGLARRRHGMLALCLLLPPSLLLLTAMVGKLQIGIRHILPVLPFLYLFVIFYLHRARWVIALLPLIVLAGVESAKAHPEYLPFFNWIAGGADNGQKYLADSNLDWGQDVARLADYLKQRNAKDYTIKVSGVRVARLVQHLGLDPASRDRDINDLRQHPHGLLAVGINAKLGLEDFKKDDDGTITRGPDYSWLKDYPLVQRIGHSIEVYDLDHRSTP